MCSHNGNDDVESQVFQAAFWVAEPLLEMVQRTAVMEHHFLGRFPSASHNRRVCFDLRDSGFKHAYIANDELEVLVC